MTRLDYDLIGGAIWRSAMASDIRGSAPVKQAKRDALRLAAIDLATTLGRVEATFDRPRFMAACGFPGA